MVVLRGHPITVKPVDGEHAVPHFARQTDPDLPRGECICDCPMCTDEDDYCICAECPGEDCK